MHVDFKITTWERVEIPEGMEEQVLKAIKEGKIVSANDIWNEAYHEELDCIKLDIEEQMTVEENGGASTIEVIENEKTIYQNGE